MMYQCMNLREFAFSLESSAQGHIVVQFVKSDL
jgi:hypothetical protein